MWQLDLDSIGTQKPVSDYSQDARHREGSKVCGVVVVCKGDDLGDMLLLLGLRPKTTMADEHVGGGCVLCH